MNRSSQEGMGPWVMWGVLLVIACIIFVGQIAGIIPSTANATRVPTSTPGLYVQRITVSPTLLPKTPTPTSRFPNRAPIKVPLEGLVRVDQDHLLPLTIGDNLIPPSWADIEASVGNLQQVGLVLSVTVSGCLHGSFQDMGNWANCAIPITGWMDGVELKTQTLDRAPDGKSTTVTFGPVDLQNYHTFETDVVVFPSYVLRATWMTSPVTPKNYPLQGPFETGLLTVHELERQVDAKAGITYEVRQTEVAGEVIIPDVIRFVPFKMRLLKDENGTPRDVPSIGWLHDVGYTIYKAKELDPGRYQLVAEFSLVDQWGRTAVAEKRTEFFSVP